MKKIEKEIQKRLFELSDEEYKEFHSKLAPTIEKDKIIGVRVPKLRALAKELKGNENIYDFLETLPHKYNEEYMLHDFLLDNIKDYDYVIKNVNEFLPYINNWAVCDSLKPKTFNKHKTELLKEIKRWIKSKEEYTIRFAIVMLMDFYLDKDFDPSYLALVNKTKNDEYYVKMAQAWYYATALAKQWDETIKFVKSNALSDWVHNKTIQKAKESYRITDKQKEYLNKLKR